MYTLYKLYDADRNLLYVGQTTNLKARLAAHATNAAWWSGVAYTDTEEYPSAWELSRGEREAIVALRPRHNVAHLTKPVVPSFNPKELEEWLPGHVVSNTLGVSRNTAVKILRLGYIRAVETQLGWLADPHSVEDYRRRKK
jgi:hypothetical protein